MLRRLLSRVAVELERALVAVFGDRVQQLKWRAKFRVRRRAWLASFEDAVRHPHRQVLMDKITSCGAPRSALEVGCNRGQNLVVLSARAPSADLYGVDINSAAIFEGRRQAALRGVTRMQLIVGAADRVASLVQEAVDVVFADALLMYIGPRQIQKVLLEMVGVTRKRLILSEWNDEKLRGRKWWRYDDGAWVYNYRELLQQTLEYQRLVIEKYPAGIWHDRRWAQFGTLVEIDI